MLNSRWTRLLSAALCLGVTVGSASIAFANESELLESAGGGDYPNQCYYDCRGCGGTCLGSGYICCRQ